MVKKGEKQRQTIQVKKEKVTIKVDKGKGKARNVGVSETPSLPHPTAYTITYYTWA